MTVSVLYCEYNLTVWKINTNSPKMNIIEAVTAHPDINWSNIGRIGGRHLSGGRFKATTYMS